MSFSPPGATQKLALDEESFQQLLAAAYTLQKHNDDSRAGNPQNDPAGIFSDIASLRSQIFAHQDAVKPEAVKPKHSKPAEAAALVADCLRRLTKADGASVCLIVDGYLRPTACSGIAAKVSGGSVASNSLVATERLRNSRAFQSANACSDIRLGPSLCVELQIGSLLAVPIERQNEIAGLVEVRWSKAGAFSDADERICKLLADLMGEVLESEAGQVNAAVPAATHMLSMARADSEETMQIIPRPDQKRPAMPSLAVVTAADTKAIANTCRVCGKSLTAGDNFCGNCGMLAVPSDDGLQSKWASMWFMQQAQNAVEIGPDRGDRLWPLHSSHGQENASASLKALQSEISDEPIQETDEAEEELTDGKRHPRGVLSVLKSRFKVRAMGR